MDSRAEGDVAVGLAFEIQPVRVVMLCRIDVCRSDHDHHAVALLQAHAVEFNIPPNIARLGELHG